MKKSKNLFLTMLILISSVMLSINLKAQGQSLPYTITGFDNLIPVWTEISLLNAIQVNNTTHWNWDGISNMSIIYEKAFDLSGVSALSITYDTYIPSVYYTPYVTFSVYIDNVVAIGPSSISIYTGTGIPINPINVQIPSTGTFTSNSMVRIDIEYVPNNTPLVFNVLVNSFKIEDANATGISKNELSNNLDVYSYGKSVYISSTANTNINSNSTITVYNLSGKIVKNENINLSNSKSIINLNNASAGMYIVTINDGVHQANKKIYIE